MESTDRGIGDVTVLTLKGRLVLEELDTSLRGMLDGLIQRGRVKLALDLRDVTYIDSAGVGFLVAKFVSVRRLGGDIKLANVPARVAHVLEITRLTRIFESFDSVEAAVRRFEQEPQGEAEHLPTSRS